MPRRAKIQESPLWGDLVVSRQIDHRIRAGYGRRVPVPDIYPYSGRQQARQSRSPTAPRQSRSPSARSPTAQSPSFGPIFDNSDHDGDGDAIMSDPAPPLDQDWEDINEDVDQEAGLIDQDDLLDLADIRRRLAELENDDALPAVFDED